MKLLKIGRDESCDIVLRNAAVSALHAEMLLMDNGNIILEDKNGTNGTTVNGAKILPYTPTTVRRGDRVQLANVPLPWGLVPMLPDTSSYREVLGIGTDMRNTIKPTGNTVSRFHATLKIDKRGRVYINDHSKNGTEVNGRVIPKEKDILLKPSDKVRCGSVNVDLKDYFPKSHWKKIVAAVLAALVVIGAGCGIYSLFNNDGDGRPQDYVKATTLVVGSYYYTVRIVDDPFIDACKKYDITDKKGNILWPEKFVVGRIDQERQDLSRIGLISPTYFSENLLKEETAKPIQYTGTAFFVSEDGKLITNKHVACPWKCISDEDRQAINDLIGRIRENMLPIDPIHNLVGAQTLYYSSNSSFKFVIEALIKKGAKLNDVNSWINRFKNSPIAIDGESDFLRIGLADHNYNSADELLPVSLCDTLSDNNIDLALIQLNTKQTPQEVNKVVNLSYAIVDEKKIEPLGETYSYIGYPLGLWLNLKNNNGGLTPRLNEIKVARKPGKNDIELQAEMIGGASGSPILDNKGRLVGVAYKTLPSTSISYGVLAKYAVELYEKSK